MLYLGALGDRHGRKLLLILGMLLSIPACLLAAWAPSVEVLIAARLIGGRLRRHGLPDDAGADHRAVVGAGSARSRSRCGPRSAAPSPRSARCCRASCSRQFWWGSVFLITLPLAVVALFMAVRFVPSHVNESTDPVDNLGGVLSVVLIASLVLAINFAPVPDEGTVVAGLAVIALAAGAGFVIRQRRAANPLYDLTWPPDGSSGSPPARASSCSAR